MVPWSVPVLPCLSGFYLWLPPGVQTHEHQGEFELTYESVCPWWPAGDQELEIMSFCDLQAPKVTTSPSSDVLMLTLHMTLNCFSKDIPEVC